VLLPTFDPVGEGTPPVVAAARRAESLGFDGLWAGDHLLSPAPVLDALCSLSAAAAVTSRIDIGLSVLQLALRNPAWAAKQLVTLAALAPGRLRLGVGVGGEYPAEFEAAGVAHSTRGRRLDELLQLLPALLRGEPVDHESAHLRVHVAGLRPVIENLPPISVGGRSIAAIRRAARYGDQWLAMWHDPQTISALGVRLADAAAEFGRPTPSIGLLILVNVDDDLATARRGAEDLIAGQYRMPLRVVERWAALGPANVVARTICEYRDAGVREFVLMPAARDPLRQYARLADVRDLVDSGRATG
jgi:alkanesulfonate monooxygenase SsuD/methylene tetrahydromethanopterin reductase-like flavin-dependent oxidoreductase (luciferase family)